MTLPDIARLSSLDGAVWGALGQRLRALGLSQAYASASVGDASRVPPALRRPVRAWRLANLREPGAYALRMLVHREPVTPGEAAEALGDLLPVLLDAGLVVPAPGDRLVSPFMLALVDDLYVLCDDLTAGEGAAMGFGDTTVGLCRAVLPSAPIGRALDLGCGAGTCALVLAARAASVVGTDINPRALALARVNAAINGITNVEFREGSLFAPVRGETFDLVVSQPPFVPRPEGARETTFLYGGTRGDELALELAAGIGPHLAPGGKAVLLVEWPDDGSGPVEARVRARVGEGPVDLLLLKMPATTADEHAATYASLMHPVLDAAFEEDFARRRRHLDALGIQRVWMTFTLLARTDGRPGWTDSLDIGASGRIRVSHRRLDKLLAARSLVLEPQRLLASRLRMPEGTVIAQEQLGPGAEVESTLVARPPRDVLVEPVDLTLEMLALLTAVHEADTVGAAILRHAEVLELAPEVAAAQVLAGVADGLAYGLLQIADEPTAAGVTARHPL